ncbi:AraC-like DNA-binding protein [Paenibacillus endophyticus]|uniref:AraC-like DNA-binding protein n=1 Tax=Paenibacillus endophyticus TaxID=1294268 RepID=A0A7W5C6U6_9BACL|nr:AraC family transcriptional regulator [Paenibacillus endophyticus]MBB3152225.1 AraC-like DNA-binding protein [Paenibacillus endophyticus]
MFLKKVPLKRKNSKQQHDYYKIVESYRDVNGKPKHRLVANIGELTLEAAEQWRKQLRAGIMPESLRFLGEDGSPSERQAIPNSGIEKEAAGSEWIEKALDYIKKNYAGEMTRAAEAKRACVSPEHFSRVFKRHTGKTFKEYVTELRIRAAQEQLFTSKKDLYETALSVGYKDGFYLSRRFKQITGDAPTIYLKRPKRIATLSYNYSASLFTLGVMPSLAVISNWTLDLFGQEAARSKIHLFQNVPKNLYAAINPTSPDLILNYVSNEESSEELRRISPLVSLPFEQMNWDEQFMRIAEIVDRSIAAKDCLKRLEELAGHASRELDHCLGKRGTAVVIELGAETSYVFGDKWGRASHLLYDALQFAPPLSMMENGSHRIGYVEAPTEEVHSFAADHMFIVLPKDLKERRKVQNIINRRCWQLLPAYQNNHIYSIDGHAFYGFDPASTEKQLKDIVHVISKSTS